MNSLGLHFGSLLELQILGLFLPNDMIRNIENADKKKFTLQYFDKSILFEPTHENNFKIKLPNYYQLSITGKQIIRHLNPKYIEDYFTWLKANYKISNYEVNENN